MNMDAVRTRIRDVLFYVMLTAELVVMLVDKSEIAYYNWTPIFRVTFVMAFGCVLLTKHTRRQWIWMILILIVCFFSYRLSLKNDLLRIFMFVFACQDIDTEKALRYVFAVSTAGCALIFLASVTGLFGNIALTTYFSNPYEMETRYTFGFGHPNAFHCMLLMQMLLFMYLWREKMKPVAYIILLVIQTAAFCFSTSRTGYLISLLMMAIFFIATRFPEKKWVYGLGAAALLLGVAFSIWAVYMCVRMEPGSLVTKIDRLLTGRIFNVRHGDHNILLSEWRPFAPWDNEYPLDMGWVRLFYWYGYVPAIMVILLIIVLMVECYRKKDAAALAWITSAVLYTVLEAHLVSVYIGRNYLLLLAGSYLCERMNRLHEPSE